MSEILPPEVVQRLSQGDNNIALMTFNNGRNDKFVSADKNNCGRLVANGTNRSYWETFRFIGFEPLILPIIILHDWVSSFALQDDIDNFVTVAESDELIAKVRWLKGWEIFYLVKSPRQNDKYVIYSLKNNKFVSLTGDFLVANKGDPSDAQDFSILPQRGDKIALMPFKNGRNDKFVSADKNIGGKLVASRTNRSYWETFRFIDLDVLDVMPPCCDNFFALQDDSDNFVGAASSGELMANRRWIKNWETFQLVQSPRQNDKYVIKSFKSCKYISVNSDTVLVANTDDISDAQDFSII
jgi:hypothetical protein